MTIKTELVKSAVADIICKQLNDFEIDETKVADTRAISALAEIQKILFRDELGDFEKLDEIVSVFCEYDLDFGSCHDF